MCWKQAWSMQAKSLQMADASTVKVFGSESFVEIYDLLMEVIGPESALEHGSPGEVLRGRLAMMFRTTLILTFGGGTNEVQRDIIAMAGLGLPHYKS
jgi:alkylation response protein AidB-like acyl-CoA dehydrogenase